MSGMILLPISALTWYCVAVMLIIIALAVAFVANWWPWNK